MMENAKEKLNFLLSKREKYIQTGVQQKEKKDCGMDQNPVSDRNDLILDRNFNKCCFCTKVFLNSKFLIQHILRRHSENLVVMYRKLNDLNASNIRDSLSQNEVISIITKEFSKLRNDLESIKSSISSYKSNSNFCHNSSIKVSNDSQICENSADVVGKVDLLTSELKAIRDNDAKIEADISDLKVQWNECDIKNLCNSTKVKDSLIYQTLKDEILLEMQNFILESNEEHKLNLNKLSLNFKADVERLEHLIRMNLENIDTSNLVQETLKSLEKEIEFFFSCHKAKKVKSRAGELNMSKEISSRVKKVKPNFSHGVNNFGSSENLLFLEKKLNVLNISEGTKNPSFSDYNLKEFKAPELNVSEEINTKLKEAESGLSEFDVSEIPLMLEKKLRDFNIPEGTNRLSNTDYNAKMKLLESERQVLSKNYHSFSDIYRYLSSTLNNSVSQRLNADKKSKKIRFSLTTQQSRKKLQIRAENVDTKLTESICDPQEGSSADCRYAAKITSENITPINISDMENHHFNSAASLKLISSTNRKRKLPSVPHNVSKELSSCDSLGSDF